MIRLFSVALLAALSAAAQTADPAAWNASTHPPQTAKLQFWRGDTVPLRPDFGMSSTGSWTFCTYWSTNGAQWWTKSWATNSSVVGDPLLWTPAMDAGARKYRLFVRAADAVGGSYRANADISMLDSPGFDPSTLPAPNTYPSLAADVLLLVADRLPTQAAWTNESVARAAGDAAASNNVFVVRTNLQAQIDAIALSGPSTGTVSSASSAASSLRLVSADSNWWVSVACGTASLWRVAATNRWIVTSVGTTVTNGIFDVSNPPSLFTSPGRWPVIVPTFPTSYLTNSSVAISLTMGPPWNNTYATQLPVGETWYRLYAGAGQGGTVTLHRVTAVTNRIGDFVSAAELSAALAAYNPSAATNALAVASNALALASAAASQAQLAAATNAIVRTYLISSNAWITANYSNQTLAVSMIATNGATNVVSVGGNNSIDPAATNLLWLALSAGLAEKADKAWGRYSPGGASNPDPDFMTWLNAPATVFASGCSWDSSGTYAVLTTAGATAFAAGTNGAFRVGPDGTNWFGYVTGGSVLVGAVPQSIAAHGPGQPGGYAEITYDYFGGDYPVLMFAPSLAVDFAVLQSVVWVDNLDGTATVTAPAESPAGFFKAVTSATFDNAFMCTMPARFAGGVIGATNALPVRYDSTITISSGGHTYRLPAQLAD